MFRFSLREIMFLTIIVGTGIGWRWDRSNSATQLQQWRLRAGALEHYLTDRNCHVEWLDRRVFVTNDQLMCVLFIEDYQPSAILTDSSETNEVDPFSH